MAEASWGRLPRRARELFAVELGGRELDRLKEFLDLLEEWSPRINLVAVRSRSELIERHLLDSLALTKLARSAGGVADFGSGGGFPAIPLAVVSSGTRFDLIESREKRSTFLRHVIRTLKLSNARVWQERAEKWKPPMPIDLVVGRALDRELLAGLARRVLEPGGRLAIMRKAENEVAPLDELMLVDRFAYELAGPLHHEVVTFKRT
jgi:16S rRNA (guanine527-N7)-methyltransferase